jgi:NADPH:quinone reductase-like Zn-dependent oxidoreductase
MSDGAGLVESIGDGVTEFKVGDHVVSCFFPSWMEGPPPIADFSTVPGDGVDGYARELVVALPTHPKDIRSPRLRLSPRPA